MLKKYFDIIVGVISALVLSILVRFKTEEIQKLYSIDLLILANIGICKIIKQSVDKNKKVRKREHTIIDNIVDKQKPMKALQIAQEPTKEGERLGALLLYLMKRGKRKMKKIKLWYDKFKGFLLGIALIIVALVEYYGGFINEITNNSFTIGGENGMAVIAGVASMVVMAISNTLSAEQKAKLKEISAKSTMDDLVKAQIKGFLKTEEANLKDLNKSLYTKENELEALNIELTSANNNHLAKQELYKMVPQLATNEDVQNALTKVNSIKNKILQKTNEIDINKKEIVNLTTKIDGLKAKL